MPKRIYRAPKRPRAQPHFSDSHVRGVIAGAMRGDFKGASLNERMLSQSQAAMLQKAGWRHIQATPKMAYWLSPK